MGFKWVWMGVNGFLVCFNGMQWVFMEVDGILMEKNMEINGMDFEWDMNMGFHDLSPTGNIQMVLWFHVAWRYNWVFVYRQYDIQVRTWPNWVYVTASLNIIGDMTVLHGSKYGHKTSPRSKVPPAPWLTWNFPRSTAGKIMEKHGKTRINVASPVPSFDYRRYLRVVPWS